MGFDYGHYLPILKGRAGEYGALREMAPDVKAGLTPLIEIPPIPWDFERDEPDKAIDQHLQRLSGKIVQSWGLERPLFLDLLWIAPDERMANGDHALAHVFGTAREEGLRLIPVIGMMRGEEYQSSCREVIAEDARGVCIRLQKEDFEESDDLLAQLTELLDGLGIPASGTDLVLDCANERVGTGNLTTWRKVATSHHLACVTHQIASLAEL